LNNIETTFEQGRRIQDLDMGNLSENYFFNYLDTLLYLFRVYNEIQLNDFSLPNELEVRALTLKPIKFLSIY